MLGTATAVLISAGLLLTGCKKEELLMEESSAVNAEDTKEETTLSESAVVDLPETESETTSFDVNNPTEEMQDMFMLMDAMNICMFESGKEYSPDDPNFFWYAIAIAVSNSGLIEAEADGITYDTMSGLITVTPALAKQFAMALFSTDELPDPTQIDYGASMTADGNYTFSIGERGLSTGILHSWIANDDGTYMAEVELQAVGEDDGREMVKFNYMLTDNYGVSDSETSMFAYSIADAVAADDLTYGRMQGEPYFTMIYQNYGNDLICEIPYLFSLQWNDGIVELNNRISEEIMNQYAYDSDSTEGWAEIKAYPITSDDYMQLVMTAINYPNYATDGEVYSYIYDIKNECALTNEDGLALAGISEQELYDAVEGCYKPDSDASTFNHAQLGGFRIKDGSVVFYLKLYIDNPEADNYDQIAAYSMKSGKLTIYDGGVLIPDDEIDVMTPPLTHGGVG